MGSSRITGTNEHISTYGNATRDYTSLATWESDTDYDLVSAQVSEVLECYADSSIFTDYITMNGAVTDADYFRIIRPAAGQKHNGTPNTGVRFRRISNGYTFYLIEQYAQIQDIAATISCSWLGGNPAVFYALGNYAKFIGCIAYDAYNSLEMAVYGFHVYSSAFHYIINCIACNCKNDGFRATLWPNYFLYLYNCLSVNNGGYGIVNNPTNGGAIIAKNCCSTGNTIGDWSGEGITKTTCTEEGATPTFVDPDNNDFHLDPSDTVCRNKGTNLSSDEIFPFNDDIDNDERAS